MRMLRVSLTAGLAGSAAAHGIVMKIMVGEKVYDGYDPNFQYMDNPPPTIGWASPPTQDRGPVPMGKYQDPDIICQREATPATTSAEIAAGDDISLQWSEWPESHHGPMLDYLADCGGDCSTVDKTQLKWFKIDGVGMTDVSTNPPTFADDDMITNNNTWTVQIPASIKAGNYVLRHETIALHQAQGAGGAQNYPQCVNLMVTGGGTDTPEGVLGTELYKEDDPGIQFNIYQEFQSTMDYTVPGPPLYSGAMTEGSSTPSPNSPSSSNGTSMASAGGSMANPPSKSSSNSGEIGNQDNTLGLIATPEEAYQNAKFKRSVRKSFEA